MQRADVQRADVQRADVQRADVQHADIPCADAGQRGELQPGAEYRETSSLLTV